MADKTELSKRERAIAAWESAVARTMNPHLTDQQSADLWKVVIKNRQTPDAKAVEKGFADVLDGASTPVRASADLLIQNLRDVLAIQERTPAPAKS